jgi:glutathione synthase/RimK-type ligase-like ATP-grasp enzyme
MRLGLDRHGVTSRVLAWEGRELDLSSVTAVWYRRPGKPQASADLQDPTHREYSEWTSAHFLEGVWETLNCQWLPAPPATNRAAHNKVVQLAVAVRVGFAVPPTLITNEPSTFLAFYAACDSNLVSKPLRDTAPKRDGEPLTLFTRPVQRRDTHGYQGIRFAPEIFQQYVPKERELRVTVVGTRVLTAEIESQTSRVTRHDWRHYDDDSVVYRPHRLPDLVASRCLALIAELQLCFGAIDMILTPEGEYVFLEINPNGQWAWVEDSTGLPISDAIADLLTGQLGPPGCAAR